MKLQVEVEAAVVVEVEVGAGRYLGFLGLHAMSSATIRMIWESGMPSRFTLRYTDNTFATCR